MKMKSVAVRFPQELHEMITEYAEASQTKIATLCRFSVYEAVFNRIEGERSHLQMLKDALEKLPLTEDQIYTQKKAIKELEAKVARFEELRNELASELYGQGGENNA